MIIEQIKQHIADSDITQSQIAKEIGVSSGAISAYLKGTYKGDNDKLTQALNDWLVTQNRAQTAFVTAPDFIETQTAKQVFGTLELAKVLRKITVIHGASGVGKTSAAKQFRHSQNNVWMVTARPSCSTLNEILYEMALELNINDAPKRAGKLSRVLQAKLTGSKGLMIIDEADHLPYAALEEIRILQEETGIGFALIGNDKVYTRMQGGVNQHHEFARLFSRLAKKTSIQSCKKNDIKAVATAWGLDLQDKDLMTALTDIGKSAGALRALTNCLELAAMYAKSTSTAITLPLIVQAREEIGGGA